MSQCDLPGAPDPTRSASYPGKIHDCCCSSELDRRSFVRLVGAGSLAALILPMPVMAGPFDNPNFDINIPADKKLSPDWVKALFVRGEPEVYRGDELKSIGMPIGGICAGHVYLSGSGTMTDWRVNEHPVNLQQGFALKTVVGDKTEVRALNQQDFPGLTFRGEYPIAKIEYVDPTSPVHASLEAFSPFLPLHTDDSSLPATVFNFTLKNTSDSPVEATLVGGLQNGACLKLRPEVSGTRVNQVIRDSNLTVVEGSFTPPPADGATRSNIIFEDWSRDAFAGWTVEGTAFGVGPIDRVVIEKEMGQLGGPGLRVVNSYFPTHLDSATGKLTSAPFTISRHFINLWIGGGNSKDKNCVNLVVDGQVVHTATGQHANALSVVTFGVRGLEGKQATLVILDASSLPWGQIGVGEISFSDVPGDGLSLEKQDDMGTMALSLLGPPADLAHAKGSIGFNGESSDNASAPLAEVLIGTLGRKVNLQPGESTIVTFIVSWHFPNLRLGLLGDVGRHYAQKFDSAHAIASYVAANLSRLTEATRRWRDTWYDSTLPYWFLDRTFLNISTVATSGCYRFADGRFYAWEGGPGCCPGTCTHVWQYAHSMARLFPELERDTRERVDLGIALTPETGVIGFRAEFDRNLAVDGQAGTIMRIYREHQMSADNAFLKRNWEKIKSIYNPLFALDPQGEGILQGAQMNTLDQPWYGQISWMSSMYVAALRAGERMAAEMGDANFGKRCAAIADNGTKNITARLYNGEYFFNIVDPAHQNSVNSGQGCDIDQVYGQSWAFQIGLPRILPEKETRDALQSLWKYNFSPDAGAYFTAHKAGRRFVNAGDAGMIMCTFPRTDWDYAKASGGNGGNQGHAYYFNETWTGNEYQVASHMIWEGMLLEGMAMIRAIHDRYHPLRRNPWSEVECGGHYARAMASHGAFIAACGFEYHGPLGHIGFAPRLNPENFRAPFVTAEGWGTYSQSIAGKTMDASLEIKSGQLRVRSVKLRMDAAPATASVKANVNNTSTAATCVMSGGNVQIQFPADVIISEGQKLTLGIS